MPKEPWERDSRCESRDVDSGRNSSFLVPESRSWEEGLGSGHGRRLGGTLIEVSRKWKRGSQIVDVRSLTTLFRMILVPSDKSYPTNDLPELTGKSRNDERPPEPPRHRRR